MLNSEQLKTLNDIFHSSIKPILEENKEILDIFIGKVDEFENFILDNKIHEVEENLLKSIVNEIVASKEVKDERLESIVVRKIKYQVLDLGLETSNNNDFIATNKISITKKIIMNESEKSISNKNNLAA